MGGWRTFRDIVAWQLAWQLRRKVHPLLRRVLRARDYELFHQIREAARSAPRNIAEGFARYKHRDFASFVRIAKSSEAELLVHFIEARDEGHLDAAEFDALDHAARKAIRVANGLILYLESTADQETSDQRTSPNDDTTPRSRKPRNTKSP